MNTVKIMIAGTHGFVGTRALQRYPDAIKVPGELLRNAGEPLTEFIRAHHPDVILNAAAISDIGTCENNPDGSFAANVVLPVVMAKAANAIGAKLVSFSSDQVYTGCDHEGPYKETDDLPTPTNVYARHKLEAEQRVLDINPDAILLRATMMYDMPMYGYSDMSTANRGNLWVNILESLLHDKPVKAVAGQYRGATYVRQVVNLLDQMFTLPGGVYNYGSENELPMPETIEKLLETLKVHGQLEVIDEKDARHHNLWMDCGKLRENGVFFDTTVEGFARCAKDYGLL